MLAGRRQLFVYWRVARGDLGAARAAARALQQRLSSENPGLQCMLLVRGDPGEGEATLMETYAVDALIDRDGVSRPLQQRIEDDGAIALGPWLRGLRHVEVFEDCSA